MEELKTLTLRALLDRSVRLFGSCPALSFVEGDPITYEELGRKVAALSDVLRKHGIGFGDRVAILSENKPTWGIAYFAVTTMGAVVVPILPEFHANEVHHILRHSEAKAIFVSEKQFDKLEGAGTKDLLSVFFIEDFKEASPEAVMDKLHAVLKAGQREYARLVESAKKITGKTPAGVREEDIASIIYTSGTTGHSKGVVLTHKNLVFDTIASGQVQKVNSSDRFLSVLPLSHAYECTIGFLLPMMHGASVAYLDKPPVPRVLLPALEKVRPTVMLTVPLIIEKIFKTKILPELTRSSLLRKAYRVPLIRKRLHKIAAGKVYKLFGGKLHFFGIGGALLGPDVELFLREGGFPYAIGYGLTETSPLAAGADPKNTRYRSTGPAIPGGQIRIDKPDPSTNMGEIWIKGEHVMKEYYRDPERTREVLTSDGWFRTGDLGSLDKDGFLYIKGRIKNTIIGPSGENIYPEEIEAIINRSKDVLESLVYQAEGQIVARVYLNSEEMEKEIGGQNRSDTEMAQKIREKLEVIRETVNASVSSYSRIHKIIEQTEPFEKTPTNKVKRFLYTG